MSATTKQLRRLRKNQVYTTIVCPNCGTDKMVIQIDLNHDIFFGCSDYPRCQHKINIVDYFTGHR